MKKVVLLFLLINSFIFSYSFSVGKTFALSGEIRLPEGKITTAERTGYFFEFYPSQQQFIEAGLGLKFNHYLNTEDNGSVTRLTTVYATTRIKKNIVGMYPYIQIRAGFPYAIDGEVLQIDRDLEGQIFASFGVGAQVAFIDWSLNYEMNTYNYTKQTGGSDRVMQNIIAASLGFKF